MKANSVLSLLIGVCFFVCFFLATPVLHAARDLGILTGGCGFNELNQPFWLFGLGETETTQCTNATEVTFAPLLVPGGPGRLRNLTAGQFFAEGGPWAATVWVNGRATNLACSAQGYGTCRDDVHQVTVKASDSVAVQIVPLEETFVSNFSATLVVEKLTLSVASQRNKAHHQ